MWVTPRALALLGSEVVDIVEQEIRESAAPGAPVDASLVRNTAVAVAALVESLLVSKRRAAQQQHPRPDRSVQARRSTSLRAQHRMRLGITRHSTPGLDTLAVMIPVACSGRAGGCAGPQRSLGLANSICVPGRVD